MSNEIQHLLQPLNFDTWTERASQAGKLATNQSGKSPKKKYLDCVEDIAELEAKSKVKPLIASQIQKLANLNAELPELKKNKDVIILSETAKNHLKEVYWSFRTGIKPEFFSKYTENGKMCEDVAIALLSELDDPDLFEMGTNLYEKCTLPRIYGNHFQGECDIKKSPTIQDTKVCWDIFTYFPHIEEIGIENLDYECQGQVYLELYGEHEFWLRYCLVDMPKELLEQQYKKIAWELGSSESEAYIKSCDEFKSKHTFSHLPIQARVCTFKVKRDNEMYLDLCKRVELARIFLNEYAIEMFYFENPDKKPQGLIQQQVNNLSIEEKKELVEILFPEKTFIIEDNKIVDDVSQNSKAWNETNKEDKIATDNFEKKLAIKVFNGLDKSLAQTIADAENLIMDAEFPEVDEIQKTEGDIVSEHSFEGSNDVKIKENDEDTISESSDKENTTLDETLEETEDSFLQQILSLSNIDDAVAFYMEHDTEIDDTKYEQPYFAKKEALSNVIDAPKIKKESKPASAPKQETFTVTTQPEKTYTGNELYVISDGIKPISTELGFEFAKDFILGYLVEKFKEWKDYDSHRNNITTFFMANREAIERDITFKQRISEMSKVEVKRLIEERRKSTVDSTKL